MTLFDKVCLDICSNQVCKTQQHFKSFSYIDLFMQYVAYILRLSMLHEYISYLRGLKCLLVTLVLLNMCTYIVSMLS